MNCLHPLAGAGKDAGSVTKWSRSAFLPMNDFVEFAYITAREFLPEKVILFGFCCGTLSRYSKINKLLDMNQRIVLAF